MTPEQEATNGKAWSEHFHGILLQTLAPRGFKYITDRKGKRKIADIDYLTKDRIKKTAVLVMESWRGYKDSILHPMECRIKKLEACVRQNSIDINVLNRAPWLIRESKKIKVLEEDNKNLSRSLSELRGIHSMIECATPPQPDNN